MNLVGGFLLYTVGARQGIAENAEPWGKEGEEHEEQGDGGERSEGEPWVRASGRGAREPSPFVKVGGYVLAMKGTAAMEELDEAKKAIKTLGLKLEAVREFPVDDTSHTVIVLKKVAPTPAKYPRRFAKIKQAPL